MDRWNPNPVGIQGLNWKPGETGDFIILKWHPNSFRKHLNWRLRQNKNRKGEGRGFEVCQTDWLAEDNIEDFGKEIYQCKANKKKKKICDTLNPQFKSGAVCLAASFRCFVICTHFQHTMNPLTATLSFYHVCWGVGEEKERGRVLVVAVFCLAAGFAFASDWWERRDMEFYTQTPFKWELKSRVRRCPISCSL